MSAIYILISVPGLLLHVFVAVPSVVDHQLTCTKCCQKCEKKLMSTSITTAYHILDEEKPNWGDTSWFWRPPWSSPPGCPCHPPCRWPPTFMSLMLSNMLKIYNHYHPRILHLSWRKFLLKWYILISATSWYPPPSCPCCPQCRRPPTHMSLMLSHTLKVNKKTWMSTNITPAYHIQVEKNPSDVINPDFSDLPGLLLQVVLAVHSVVDHQLICT